LSRNAKINEEFSKSSDAVGTIKSSIQDLDGKLKKAQTEMRSRKDFNAEE